MAKNFKVENSKARTSDQYDDQKVLFKYAGKNVGELEMRNDSKQHYGEVRFNMNRGQCLELLDENITEQEVWREADEVLCKGSAIKNFGKWSAPSSI